jgi:hypothetical protein
LTHAAGGAADGYLNHGKSPNRLNSRNEDFFVLGLASKEWRGGVLEQYAAQDMPQLDGARAEKDRFN